MPPKSSQYGFTASIAPLRPLVQYLRARGIDPTAILARAHLDESALDDTNARLGREQIDNIWRDAIELARDPALGLHVASSLESNSFPIFGYLAQTSDSGFDAINRIGPFLRLMADDHQISVELERERAILHWGPAGGLPLPRYAADYGVGAMVTLARLLGGDLVRPREAWFVHDAPDYADEYRRVLEVEILFDADTNAVVFPRSLLSVPNPDADQVLRDMIERHASDMLARLPEGNSLSERVRHVVARALPDESPAASAVAEALGMGERSLRRRLEKEGTSYQKVVDDLRCELARRYLDDDGLGIDETSYLLGFSDASAFNKAFRRWTGRSPTEYAKGRGEG